MARITAYLDYNATAPAKPGVADAMTAAVTLGGNASSVHERGRSARRVIETARTKLAAMTGARAADIVFTSGGTEANRLALNGTGRKHLLASAIEHPSVIAHCRPENRVRVDASGRLDLADLEHRLAGDGQDALVSIMLANNETGVIQPVAEAAAITHAAGALLHCDAVQGLGKLPLDLAELGADMVTVSAHKIGGPAGIGALILRPGLALATNREAGGQEQGRRPGTENLAGIAGFDAALDHVDTSLADRDRQQALRARLETALDGMAVIFGAEAPRLAATVCLAMPGVPSETQVMAFDLAGFCVSAGSACSSGKVQASPVLAAMGIAPDLAGAAIRVSFGLETTEAEIDAFASAWKQLYDRKQAA